MVLSIQASRCRICERTVIPPRDTCPYCGISAGDSSPVKLAARGVVLSYTILEMPPSGFEPPVLLALVELDQGARILGIADKKDISSIGIGKEVEIQQDSEGRFLLRM
ncbi:MAG: hypothetical protein EAX95_04730 [Candidatus Thorarchaeota archaeon]|nr:hypothetical protein [Candidatus Thorarchaeota archaeon]